MIDQILLGLEVLGKSIRYTVYTPGINLLFWLIIFQLLIELTIISASSSLTINHFG
ncbi:MAG: hypothetical protein QNJ37_21695 [Crocosphaera sp.]|nr:hypothetical protein [Crocosphaera sp.]